MIIPTVRVHHPLDYDVCMVINAADLTNEHELWTDPVAEPTDLRVAKGARGLWFVKRGSEAISPGFKTEAEAEDAATRA